MRAAPAYPDGASIVQPVTPAERTATALFLSFVADLADWGAENAERAKLARKACS